MFRLYTDYDPDDVPPQPESGWTRFICISDTHSRLLSSVPLGDVLIHAGDLSRYGTPGYLNITLDWLKGLPHPVKIIIAGNHDLSLDENYPWPEDVEAMAKEEGIMSPEEMRLIMKDLKEHGIHYLQFESFRFQSPSGKEWHVFGSPASPLYAQGAFQYTKENAQSISSLIPRSTEILLTHTPPYRILDKTRKGKHAGCRALLERLDKLSACRLHVFGHIHEAFGATVTGNGRISVNAAVPEASCVVIVDMKD